MLIVSVQNYQSPGRCFCFFFPLSDRLAHPRIRVLPVQYCKAGYVLGLGFVSKVASDCPLVPLTTVRVLAVAVACVLTTNFPAHTQHWLQPFIPRTGKCQTKQVVPGLALKLLWTWPITFLKFCPSASQNEERKCITSTSKKFFRVTFSAFALVT